MYFSSNLWIAVFIVFSKIRLAGSLPGQSRGRSCWSKLSAHMLRAVVPVRTYARGVNIAHLEVTGSIATRIVAELCMCSIAAGKLASTRTAAAANDSAASTFKWDYLAAHHQSPFGYMRRCCQQYWPLSVVRLHWRRALAAPTLARHWIFICVPRQSSSTSYRLKRIFPFFMISTSDRH